MKTEGMIRMSLPDKHTDNSLQLSPIKLNDDYREKWNITLNDFVCLTRNGQLISDFLYRVGGGGVPDVNKDYFMLLKYVEAFYPDSITKEEKRKPHLEGRWCILNKEGVEKVEFPHFKNPYLVRNSVIYSIDNDYYNIETGQLYCKSYSSLKSSDYLFLSNDFDKDKSKRGVMKINKKDGTWELFL